MIKTSIDINQPNDGVQTIKPTTARGDDPKTFTALQKVASPNSPFSYSSSLPSAMIREVLKSQAVSDDRLHPAIVTAPRARYSCASATTRRLRLNGGKPRVRLGIRPSDDQLHPAIAAAPKARFINGPSVTISSTLLSWPPQRRNTVGSLLLASFKCSPPRPPAQVDWLTAPVLPPLCARFPSYTRRGPSPERVAALSVACARPLPAPTPRRGPR